MVGTGPPEELARDTQEVFGIPCSFHCPRPVLAGNGNAATHLFCIAQEAVHNAAKHGKPKNIRISLRRARRRIVVSVVDDGVGFPEKARESRGMGLRIMRYRADSIGAMLLTKRVPRGGRLVSCSVAKRILE